MTYMLFISGLLFFLSNIKLKLLSIITTWCFPDKNYYKSIIFSSLSRYCKTSLVNIMFEFLRSVYKIPNLLNSIIYSIIYFKILLMNFTKGAKIFTLFSKMLVLFFSVSTRLLTKVYIIFFKLIPSLFYIK